MDGKCIKSLIYCISSYYVYQNRYSKTSLPWIPKLPAPVELLQQSTILEIVFLA
jgi:hypothetical protein